MNDKASRRIGFTMVTFLLAISVLIAYFSYSFLYLPNYDENVIRKKRMYSFLSLHANTCILLVLTVLFLQYLFPFQKTYVPDKSPYPLYL